MIKKPWHAINVGQDLARRMSVSLARQSIIGFYRSGVQMIPNRQSWFLIGVILSSAVVPFSW
jgi:hypothetical protein